jgi:hypothetical protein
LQVLGDRARERENARKHNRRARNA